MSGADVPWVHPYEIGRQRFACRDAPKEHSPPRQNSDWGVHCGIMGWEKIIRGGFGEEVAPDNG